jgi:hypothetical protein
VSSIIFSDQDRKTGTDDFLAEDYDAEELRCTYERIGLIGRVAGQMHLEFFRPATLQAGTNQAMR